MILSGAVCRVILIVALSSSLLVIPKGALAGWACVPEEKQCRSVRIVHDSWHAAIVLRKNDLSESELPELADFPGAHFIEFSWGDKDYFPDPNSGASMAIKAAFWSAGSVLHVVGFDQDVRKFYPKAEIIELRLSRSAYDRLVDYISQSFSRPQPMARAPASSGLYSYSRFYPSTRKFSLMNTCNTWVVRAFEMAGLPVSSGMVITAGQLADQFEKITAGH